MTHELAVLGGRPVRDTAWPLWPRATETAGRALAEVLGSGRWTVSGPYQGTESVEQRFAKAYASYTGTAYCTPTTAGTTALTIALQALGIGPGDEVLVPGLTWVACASAVLFAGATPVLVDCDPRTLAISADAARAACTPRTAAIMVVHPFCNLADLDAFVALSAEKGLPLIEDSAQAHGARWRDRPVGSYGVVGCFSMQQSKLLTAGEGGAVVTNDAELHSKLEQLRLDGRRYGPAPIPGRLELVEVGAVQGRNFCLTEFQAALLLDGLVRLDAENEERARTVKVLVDALRGVPGLSLLAHDDPRVTRRTYYNAVLRFDLAEFGGSSIDAIASALSTELGAQTSPVYIPLNRHPLLRADLADSRLRTQATVDAISSARLPVAEEARRTCLTLPHPLLLAGADGVADIVAALGKLRGHAHELAGLPQTRSARAF
ncbi:hypothetical protein GCM10029976_032690 [Kribbella albertanoniae]|uniref:DegT/DnrJ/EryC1/StrS family aminotransferase n=1 Tax=Kribbella albertanoniae TaxID=1266829 RepID=A0A4R4QIB7_9ACTN|nr:DegT/DnrJ/EryC1/StrS family aminotransferase [Kribbella albertanoniae]TDC35511.1 DegT/DnrJ/EryC1/StrS family aminotransferase [Kribbella albertanoniae]